jgi:hypothetical protein
MRRDEEEERGESESDRCTNGSRQAEEIEECVHIGFLHGPSTQESQS